MMADKIYRILVFVWFAASCFYSTANNISVRLLGEADSIFATNNYAGAHKVFLAALEQGEKENHCRVQMLSNRGVGVCYYYLYEKDHALEWFRKYLDAVKFCRADSFLYDAYYLMNVLFIEKGLRDSVGKYSRLAISQMKKYKKFAGLSQLYSTLAEFHIQTTRRQKEIVRYLELAEAYAREARDTGMMAFAKMKQFNYHYYYLKDYPLALEQINDAEKLYVRIGNLEALTNAYRAKAECLAMLRDTSAAFYMNKWFIYKDSVFDKEKAAGVAKYEALFETKKKEEEIKLQKEKLLRERKVRQLYLVLALMITGLAVLIGLLFFQRNKFKTRQLLQELNEERIREVFAAEQNERIRIARDLHDSIGQKLAVIRMLIPENLDQTAKLTQYLDEATGEVREISHNLIPEILRFGLDKALQGLVDWLNSSQNMKVNYSYSLLGPPREEAPKQTILTVYRIVQEILGNIVKHSKAQLIEISVTDTVNHIDLSLKDNGKGFNTQMILNSSGIGWNNIFARVKLLNGEIKVDSALNQGTSVHIKIPLDS